MIFLKKTTRNRLTAYCFLLPNLLGFLVFTLLPVFTALGLSFMRWDSYSPIKYVGLRNFATMFRDSSFIIAFWNTLYFTGLTVPLTVIFALLLALALNKGFRSIKIIRAIHFFPHVASLIAVAVVWQFLYHPDMGPINHFLRAIGIATPPRWTASATWAMPAVIIMTVWKSAGYYMTMFLAGLQAIPDHLYEVATIDGASPWQKFRYVTLPLLTPTLFFVLTMNLIYSFKVFDQIHIMTQGGPGRATSVLVYYIYVQAFVNQNFGYASAMATTFFLIILGFTILQFRLQERWVTYLN
ncbi:MAG TPA: sugar ABC transporter permease [Firmicutes bacterium]|jgi:multiple sugar transport system permease protein|nr:sugar ABC transporter permease [Bacillota bacterium]